MAHGRYTIVGKLADGGMAEIFLARQHGAEGFEKPVILKRILSAFSADQQFRNMFLDEAHISMSLSHGNIVQVLDLGTAGERTFLVLELVDGWDLERVMERAQATGPDHPWPPSLALYVTAEISRALSYAHAKRGRDGRPLGIVHRDVSPSNVLISEQGEVKLADFGIAKAETKRERTATGIIKGKIGFMSPEQARGHLLDARSDLFSVGTLMYLMLTGRRPFDGGTELESMLRAQKADFRPPEELNPYLPREVTAIVNKAMQGEPGSRYQTADDLLSDVEAVLRKQYRSAGQTELKTWLAALARRDGDVPIGRSRPWTSAPESAVAGVGELSAGISVVLSDPEPRSDVATVIAPVGGDSGAAGAAPPSGSDRGGAVASAPAAAAGAPAAAGTPAFGQGAAGTGTATQMRRRGGRSRIGVGFFLGALCMLGAVYGIRWLAQWAGREQPTASRWLGLPTAADEPARRLDAGAVAEPVAAREPTAGSGKSAPGTGTAVAGAGAGAGVGGGPSAGGGSPAVAEPVPPPSPPPAGGAAKGGAATDDSPADDDEKRLLARLVPDAGGVIGEDDADEEQAHRAAAAAAGGDGRPAPPVAPGAGAAAGAASRAHGARSASASRPPPVTLRITSSPVGAVVRSKKHVLGRTPLAARFNPGNTYELTFVKEGYDTASRRVAVAGGKPRTVSVAMKKSRPTRRFFGR